MKKLILLSVIMCLSLIGTAQESYFDFSVANESGQMLYYNILDSVAHTVEFTCPGQVVDYQNGWEGYQQPTGQLILPSTVSHNGQDYTVVAVGDNAFYRCDGIRGNLSIPSSVTRLGKRCLEWFNANTDTLFLSEGLIEADEEACAGTRFYIGHLPSTMEKIGFAAFAEKDFPRHLVLPQSLRIMGAAAFSECFTIKEVTIPENVDSIGGNAFYFNTQLQQVNFNARNCAYIHSNAFQDSSIKRLVIGEQVQSLECWIYIPGVSTVTFKGQNPPAINENSFAYYNANFYVPKGCWERYHNAPHWANITKLFELPGSFASEGAEWYFNKLSTQSILNDYHRMVVLGKDTIIVNGEATEVSVISNPLHSDTLQLVYEKDDVVYWYNPVKQSFTTLYDYNARVGDSWTVSIDTVDYDILVIAIQNVIYNHRSYQIQWVRNISPGMSFDGRIIKGIGYEHGIFPFAMQPDSQDTTYINGIRCYLENDTIMYHNGYLDCDQVVGWNGFEWYYEIQNDDGSTTYQHLEYTSDTTINGKRPKIIVRSNTHYDRDTVTEVTHEYIYEENGKVYWWNKQLQQFTTLYNYAAEIGDEWEVLVGTERLSMHVDTVENIEHEGNPYTLLRVSDADGLFSGDIVCGIGHMTSFFPERLMNRGKNYRVEGMRCYWVDGELVFKLGDKDCDEVYEQLHNGVEDSPSAGSDTFTVYPNPANNVLFVETRRATALPAEQKYRIANLMGQTLLQGTITAENQQINIEKLPVGMYFISVGGQTLKFVVK